MRRGDSLASMQASQSGTATNLVRHASNRLSKTIKTLFAKKYTPALRTAKEREER
jgi:hypothetical protein